MIYSYQTAQFRHVDGRKKKSKTEEDGSYQTAQVGHGDGRKKKSKTEEDGSYHTAQIGLGDRGRKKSKNGLYLIWIEIGFFLNQGMSPFALQWEPFF